MEVNELGEVVHREPLLGYGTINVSLRCRPPGCQCGCGAVEGLSLQPPPRLTRDDVPQAVGLIVGAVVSEIAMPLRTSGRHVHRPLLA